MVEEQAKQDTSTKQVASRALFWRKTHAGFEVLRAVAMYSPIFLDIKPCSSLKVNRRFGGRCRLHLQRRRISQETSIKQITSRACFMGWLPMDLKALYPRRYLKSYMSFSSPFGWSQFWTPRKGKAANYIISILWNKSPLTFRHIL
jgi:hypothetical protein